MPHDPLSSPDKDTPTLVFRYFYEHRCSHDLPTPYFSIPHLTSPIVPEFNFPQSTVPVPTPGCQLRPGLGTIPDGPPDRDEDWDCQG
eukprot:768580-Hanusia_phi.AAC.12